MQVRSVSPGKSVPPRVRRKVSLEGSKPDRGRSPLAGQGDCHSRTRKSAGACGPGRSGPCGCVAPDGCGRKFDASKNVAFQVYAKLRIKGAILAGYPSANVVTATLGDGATEGVTRSISAIGCVRSHLVGEHMERHAGFGRGRFTLNAGSGRQGIHFYTR